MKKLISALLLLTMTLSLFACSNKSYAGEVYSDNNADGSAQTETVWLITKEVLYDEEDEGYSEVHEYIYNDNGVIIKEYGAESFDWSLYTHWTSTYDDHGNITEDFSYYFDELQTYKKYTNEYSDGKLTYKTTYDHDGNVLGFCAYVYTDGTLSQVNFCEEDGTIGKYTSYTYSNGKLSKESTYYIDGTLKGETIYTYNENGIIAEKTESDYINIEQTSHQTYIYNESGNLVKFSSCLFENGEPYGMGSTTEYTYNEAGQLIKVDEYYGQTLVDTTVFRYSEDGAPVSCTITDSDGYTYRVEFTAIKKEVPASQSKELEEQQLSLLQRWV